MRATFSALFVGVANSAARSSPIFSTRRDASFPAHSHELPFFALLLDGSYAERYGRCQSQYGPLTVMFRPAGVPHQDEIGPAGVRFFEIELRPVWKKSLAECATKPGSSSLELARDDLGGGPLLWLTLRLFREIVSAVATDDLTIESLLSEILATALRPPARKAPRWLARILDKLKSEYSRRFTLDELAAEAGVHPVHLSRVFRRSVGEGIGEYLHRLRIRAACEKMRLPDATLADLSFSAGFADQSHFTRTFRKVTGMTPAAFRSSVLPKTSKSPSPV